MSTELAGGAGFAYEDGVAALYLANILSAGAPLGLPDTLCERVLFQRAESGHPLDDLLVVGRRQDGEEVSLDLQITTKISLTAGNRKFADIVRRAWQTIEADGFVIGRDRVGAAVGTIAAPAARDMEFVCEAARDAVDSDDFATRIKSWSIPRRRLVETVRSHISATAEISDVRSLLRHFALLQFSVGGEAARDAHNAIEQLRHCTSSAEELWHRLLAIAQSAKTTGGSLNSDLIEERLRGSVTLRRATIAKDEVAHPEKYSRAAPEKPLPLVVEIFDAVVRSASALEMAYNKRRTAFIGRNQQQKDLRAFFADSRSLLWWQLSGDGGQGKSRLALETALELADTWHGGFLTKDALLQADWKTVTFYKPTLIIIDYLSDIEKATAFVSAMRDLRARTSECGGHQIDQPLRFLALERSSYDLDLEEGLFHQSWLGAIPDFAEQQQLILDELVFKRKSCHLGALSDGDLDEVAASWRRSRGFSPFNPVAQRALWDFLSGHRPDDLKSREKGARPLYAIIFAETYEPGDVGFTLETGLRRILANEHRQLFGTRNAPSSNLALLANMIERVSVSNLDDMPTNLAKIHGGVESVAQFYGLSEENMFYKNVESAGRANGYTGRVETAIQARAPDIVAEFDVIESLRGPGQSERINLLARDAWKLADVAFMSFLHRLRQDFGAESVAIKLLATAPSKVAVSAMPEQRLNVAATLGLPGLTDALLKEGVTPSLVDSETGAFPALLAAQDGHTEVIVELISAGADVNQRVEQTDVFPLLIAAQNGHTEVAAALITAGADVNAIESPKGTSPLLMAAKNGHTETVATLVEAGASLSIGEGWSGKSPLLVAAMRGHAEIVRLLVEAGANANQVGEPDGKFPLFLAAQGGYVETVDALVSGGAEVNQQHISSGALPLHIAAQNGHTHTVATLISAGADIDRVSEEGGLSPLFLAAENGHTETVVVLTAAGAIVDRANEGDGLFPLLAAAQNGDIRTVGVLVAANAEVNQLHHPSGISSLLLAAQNGHTEVAAALITAGADINAIEKKRGISPLFMAATNGHTETVATLVEAGASLSIVGGSSGKLPLLAAAMSGHAEIVKLLVEAGANANQVGEPDGLFPLYLAAEGGYVEIVDALVSGGAEVNQLRISNGAFPLLIAAQNGHTEIVSKLISAGADVNRLNRQDGNFALLVAAQNGCAGVIDALISARADVNQVNEKNGTFPIYLAAQDGHTDCVKALIKNGAGIDQQLEKNSTFPLLMAANNGHTETVAALVEAGADVNQRHIISGNTPLTIAAKLAHKNIVDILRNSGAKPI